jgi:site-specific DNA-cytosine methylase
LSIAGKKEGLQGKDSSLIYEVLRLLKVSEKPKVLIMENVSNLVNKTFIEGFEE